MTARTTAVVQPFHSSSDLILFETRRVPSEPYYAISIAGLKYGGGMATKRGAGWRQWELAPRS